MITKPINDSDYSCTSKQCKYFIHDNPTTCPCPYDYKPDRDMASWELARLSGTSKDFKKCYYYKQDKLNKITKILE